MNKVILLGRLTKDPEIRYSQSTEPVCISRFTVAVDRKFKKEGEQASDFINCVAFRKTAEFMEKHIKKGMLITVEGSLSVRSYDDNEGNRRWITEVNVNEVGFAESRAAYEARMAKANNASETQRAPEGFTEIDTDFDEKDDLPF